MRLFAALPLPDPAAERLERLQEGLPEGRPVPSENFHVTLGFFDECDRHVAADIDSALSGIRCPALDLWFDGLGVFGAPEPRVIYAALRADPALTRLREKTVQAARDAGLDLRRERFQPHVSLVRLNPGQGRGPRIGAWLAARAGFTAGPLRFAAFCLYASERGNGGAHYVELVRYPLQA